VNPLIDQMIQILVEMLENGEELPDEVFGAIADVLEQQLTPKDQPIEAPVPYGAELLWHISNGQTEAFINYLQTVPDPSLNNLLKDQTQLAHTISELSERFPPGQPPPIGGIEKAPLNSSNIWGFKYDPATGGLNVRFQGGSTYHYDNVPNYIFNIFQRGSVPAKTTGQNQHGAWWKGKNPSLGAAFYDLIRQGPYPYERVA
jgi:hypothetical protein